MTRSNGAPASDRQYNAAWQKRFGVKSPRAAQAAALKAAKDGLTTADWTPQEGEGGEGGEEEEPEP